MITLAIFGATSDIAKAVSRAYAAKGAGLVLVGRDSDGLDQLAADLKVRGAGETRTVVADLADIDALATVSEHAWGCGLDVVLIAHGSLPDQAAVRDDPAATAQAIGLNFVSAAAICAGLAARFEAKGTGTIAVITSVAGDRGRQSNYVYGAAKGGLQRYLEGLRHRLAPAGVQVLDVRPGFVATRMTAHVDASGPMWATPQQVAADIVKAIGGGRGVLYTPWFWRFVMLIIRSVPSGIFHRTKL